MQADAVEHHDEESYEVWPALADLLAATSMIFLVLFAIVVYDRVHERGEMETLRNQLVSRLRKVPRQPALFAIGTDPQLVKITLLEDVTFPTAKYRLTELREGGRQALEEIGAILNDSDIAPLYEQVMIVGHTDQQPTGRPEFTNWELSTMRASAVARFLIEGVGLDPCRVTASGAGAYYPQVPPEGVVNRPQNRRIEIVILPALANRERVTSACYRPGDGTLGRPSAP